MPTRLSYSRDFLVRPDKIHIDGRRTLPRCTRGSIVVRLPSKEIDYQVPDSVNGVNASETTQVRLVHTLPVHRCSP